MTDRIALFLGLLIVIALGIDWQMSGWSNTLFLASKLADLIEWLKFWR